MKKKSSLTRREFAVSLAAAGATLTFGAGNYTLDPGTTIGGAGALDFAGGTVVHINAGVSGRLRKKSVRVELW